MKQKFLIISGCKDDEDKVQSYLNSGWEIKQMTSAAYSPYGPFSSSTAPNCFVYLVKND